jgi:predicted SAM-dependent methyltransferase
VHVSFASSVAVFHVSAASGVTCDLSANANNTLKLNLGCGPNGRPGWVNVDGSWNAWLSNHLFLHKTVRILRILGKSSLGVQWNIRPLVHDLTKPLPFKDDSVSVIYASHVLEHLYFVDAQKLLMECRRVLKSNGVIRLVVPDLRAMVETYLDSKNGNASFVEKTAAADRLNERLAYRSAEPPTGNALLKFYSLWKDFHHHKWMYDSDSLFRYMTDAGFSAVSEKRYLESDIPNIEEVEEADRILQGAGVCLEGKKP